MFKLDKQYFFCISNDQNLSKSLGLFMEFDLKLSSCYKGENFEDELRICD